MFRKEIKQRMDGLDAALQKIYSQILDNFMRVDSEEREIQNTQNQFDTSLINMRHDIDEIKKHIEEQIGKSADQKEIEDLRTLVLTKIQRYEELNKELAQLAIKQKEFIKMAAVDAVKEVLKGQIKQMVKETIAEAVKTQSEEALLDGDKSVLGISREITGEIIDELSLKVPNAIIKEDSDDQPSNEEEARKKDVLSLPKHESFPKLQATIKAGLMPMLVGPAGTGKSTAVEQAAFDLGLKFYSANRVQMAFELTGYQDASGQYQPTQFYQAYKNGGVFFLDEIDGSSPEALVTINTAMAQGYMNFPTGKVYMNKNFRLVAAGNTYGTGADAQYVGRNELDAATLDRFVVIRWDYDKKLETNIIKDTDLLKLGWSLRKACEKLKLPIIISTRGLINAYKLSESKTFQKEEVLESVLFEGVDAHDLLTIKREVEESGFTMRNQWYSALSNLVYQQLSQRGLE